MALLDIFASAILPIVVVAAVGFALGRTRDVDPDPLTTVTVFVLAPALVVHSLATAQFGGGTMVGIVLAVVAVTLAMLGVGEVAGRIAGQREPLLGAFVMVGAFPNVGNYGIPLADFAFGGTGRSVAVLVTAVQGVLLYTVGVYVAARGGDRSPLASMRRAFGVPLVYAVVAALGARWLGVVPPTESTLMTTLELVGNASIPVMLLILGIQLSNVRVEGSLRAVGAASALKLLLTPLVGLAAVLLVGFEDPTVGRVVVLLTASPTAVTPIILVGAFSGDSEGLSPGAFVSTAVFLTTVASVVTVTATVALLQSGVVL